MGKITMTLEEYEDLKKETDDVIYYTDFGCRIKSEKMVALQKEYKNLRDDIDRVRNLKK
jgi:major membrane immunogen (membrane-anchored lipoprotein)